MRSPSVCHRVLLSDLTRDLKHMWVRAIPYGVGTYNEALAACELEGRFVAHETAHLRFLRCVIG